MSRREHPPRAEEWANALTHGLGVIGSLVAIPILVLAAQRSHDALQLAGATIYGLTLLMLYSASAAYHAVPPSPAKAILRRLDHSAIYLLIAGTYTPFALGPLRGALGWSLLGVMWSMALVGVVIKGRGGFGRPWLSTVLYVVMGWFAVVVVGPLFARVGWNGVMWLLAGGLCYTGGVVFYATDHRVKFGHAVWHLFVLAGSACHFVAVIQYAGLPTLG